MSAEALHVRLRLRREALGLTQYELADRLGIMQSGVSELENGRETKYSTLKRWADALGYDAVDFQLVDRRGAS